MKNTDIMKMNKKFRDWRLTEIRQTVSEDIFKPEDGWAVEDFGEATIPEMIARLKKIKPHVSKGWDNDDDTKEKARAAKAMKGIKSAIKLLESASKLLIDAQYGR